YTFQKEIDYVNMDEAAEFHTLDLPSGLIREWEFSVALGDRVTVSLPMGTGELFVLNFVPQLMGVEPLLSWLFDRSDRSFLSHSSPVYHRIIRRMELPHLSWRSNG
ncbi:hypothetical protein PMAYCL1PPCAC_18559, partial [Pristionchus mayeri]